MIFEIAQNFPIKTFNGHCYALKTSLEYMTFYVPITLAVKNDVSGSIERCNMQVRMVQILIFSICRKRWIKARYTTIEFLPISPAIDTNPPDVLTRSHIIVIVNKAVYTAASVVCGWAGAVWQLRAVITDGPTDRRTDIVTYRVARTRLKIGLAFDPG